MIVRHDKLDHCTLISKSVCRHNQMSEERGRHSRVGEAFTKSRKSSADFGGAMVTAVE